MIAPVTIATTANDCDVSSSKVTELLDRLSDHYGPSIHASSAADDDDDPSLLSPFAQEIFRLLVDQSRDGTDTAVVLSAMVQYYRSSIRRRLWRQQQQQSAHLLLNHLAVPILLHWEHLLRLYVRHVRNNEEEEEEVVDEATLQAIAWDITIVQEQGNSSQHQHVVRIVLLRLLDTLLQQRQLSLDAAVGRSIYCATVASFLAERKSYASLVPVDRIMDVTRYAGGVPTRRMIPDVIGWDAHRLWKSVGLNDDALAAASAADYQLARGILQSLVALSVPEDEAGTIIAEDDQEDPTTLLERRLVQHLGVVECAEQVRRHFFGQDGGNSSLLAQPTPPTRRLHLGRTITEANNKDDETRSDAFQTSRLRVVIRFCCLLQSQDDDTSSAVLSTLAPVLYTLLDHADADAVRWGSSLLIRLLLLRGEECYQRTKETGSSTLIYDNLLTMLHSTIRTQRCGKTLLLLGTAQHLLLHRMFSHASTQQPIYERQLQVAHQWLHIVLHNNRHHTTHHMLWGLIVGGVLPSLHALLGPGGDVLDTKVLSLARPSLQALLPLLEPDNDEHDGGGLGCFRTIDVVVDDDDNGGEDEIQHSDTDLVQYSLHVATTICLLQVLRFGYYVTQRHSGKILCTLIAFVRRRKRSSALYQLVITVAAVAVITGGPLATTVLDRVEASSSPSPTEDEADSSTNPPWPSYDSKVQAIVAEIRQEVERLLHQKEISTSATATQ